jgi:hypothetical protein
MDTRFSQGAPQAYIQHKMFLTGCTFDPVYYLVPRNYTFTQPVEFSSCTGLKIIFKECEFQDQVRFIGNEVGFVLFEQCKLSGGLRFTHNHTTGYLSLQESALSMDPLRFRDTFDIGWEHRLLFIENRNEPMEVRLERTAIHCPDSLAYKPHFFLDLSQCRFTNLKITGCKLGAVLNIAQSEVENLFMLFDSDAQYPVLVEALNINPLNTKVQWSNLQGQRMSVMHPTTRQLQRANEVAAEGNELAFTNLVACYATFYEAFRQQGNRLSANACYVEWKNLETEYLRQTYPTSEGVHLYFSYIMNVFLRDFCDYGTNPLKSILLSCYVLLAFAGVYFIYPDEVTNSKRGFYTRIRLYARYLTTPSSLAQLYLEHKYAHADSNPDSAELSGVLRAQGKKLPFIFRLMGIRWLRKHRHKWDWEYRLYQLIDLSPEEWSRLKGFRRVGIDLIYGVLVGVLFLYLIAIRALDSITLSLNVFSTLGYGSVPLKGIPRYLTVLEGFIGWFLLSIFSVSLISQVIQ